MNNGSNFESHKICIDDRRHTDLTGIDDVISFDDVYITVHSALGNLTIEGEEMKIENFSAEKGLLSINGKINAIYYSDSDNKKHLLSKKNNKQ